MADPATSSAASLRFTPERLARRDPGPTGAESTLLHFAIVTYQTRRLLLSPRWHAGQLPDLARPDARDRGGVERARYPLLASLDLVPLGDVRNIHSVLVQHQIDFTICLPPVVVGE